MQCKACIFLVPLRPTTLKIKLECDQQLLYKLRSRQALLIYAAMQAAHIGDAVLHCLYVLRILSFQQLMWFTQANAANNVVSCKSSPVLAAVHTATVR